jgi:glyoxylase-like metal-dependent hydrolase (beta-lactamase superfamily II)
VASEDVKVEPLEVGDNTYLIDVRMFGEANFGGVYYIDDDRSTIIETGTSHDYGVVLSALDKLGVDRSTIRNVIVTHIHLDHAGGAGFLLDHLPQARVYVHERGYPHLAEPQRLLESAARALGKAFRDYGTLKPIPESRMTALKGGEVIDLGGRELEIIYTPGHARHHVCVMDRSSRCVFAGDAAGIYFPEDRRLIPTTPFPEFDLPQALETMRMMERLNPRAILYTHFGPRTDATRALRDQVAEYERWGRRTKELLAEGELQAAVRRLYDEWYSDVEGFPSPFVERIIETNLKGFQRYFERTGGDAPPSD